MKIKSLPLPDSGQVTYWDNQLTGFGLRVSQGGTKTFIVMYGRTRKRKTIGRYPVVPLSDARGRAREILLQVALNPHAGPSHTVCEARNRFLRVKEGETRQTTYNEYKRLLETHCAFPGAIEDVSTSDVVNVLDKIARPSEKAHAYTAIKVFLNWCVERHLVKHNVLSGVKKPKVQSPRERVLSDDELKAVWEACDSQGKYGRLVQLLMATGQRRNQIACLEESWVDWNGKTITYPARVMKNGAEHSVPMGPLAEFVLRQVQAVDGYYFSPEGLVGQPFSSWSKNKTALDKAVDVDAWCLHDLRRTWATNAARLEVAPHVIERVLSHKTGTLSPLARVYNRWRYQDETRVAVTRVQNHIIGLLTP